MTFPSAPGPSEAGQYQKTGAFNAPEQPGAITQETVDFRVFLQNVAKATDRDWETIRYMHS